MTIVGAGLDILLRDAATAAGLSYSHARDIEAGTEPLLDADARDLGAVLGCPSGWLRDGPESPSPPVV